MKLSKVRNTLLAVVLLCGIALGISGFAISVWPEGSTVPSSPNPQPTSISRWNTEKCKATWRWMYAAETEAAAMYYAKLLDDHCPGFVP